MGEISKTRYVWLDYAKVVCIFSVVFGHMTDDGIVSFDDTVSRFIYLFHVPAFFIISGILYRPKNYMDTIKQLFLPVLFFSLLMYPWYLYGIWNQGRGWSFETLISQFVMGFLCYDYKVGVPIIPPFWFVMTLLLMRLLSDALAKYNVSGWIVVPFSLVVLYFSKGEYVFDSYLFLPQRALLCFPLFFFGQLLKPYLGKLMPMRWLLIVIGGR